MRDQERRREELGLRFAARLQEQRPVDRFDSVFGLAFRRLPELFHVLLFAPYGGVVGPWLSRTETQQAASHKGVALGLVLGILVGVIVRRFGIGESSSERPSESASFGFAFLVLGAGVVPVGVAVLGGSVAHLVGAVLLLALCWGLTLRDYGPPF